MVAEWIPEHIVPHINRRIKSDGICGNISRAQTHKHIRHTVTRAHAHPARIIHYILLDSYLGAVHAVHVELPWISSTASVE